MGRGTGLYSKHNVCTRAEQAKKDKGRCFRTTVFRSTATTRIDTNLDAVLLRTPIHPSPQYVSTQPDDNVRTKGA